MTTSTLTNVARVLDTEWINYRHTWRGTAFSAFLGPLLYLGAIGFGLGSLVEGDGASLGTTATGEPVDYVTFLAPGLIAATAMQVGGSEGIFGTVGRIKWRQTWQTAATTPLMPADVAIAHTVWIGFRAGLAAIAYAVVTALFGILPLGTALLTVPAAMLGGVALGSLAAAAGAWIPEPQTTNVVQRFVIIPMFLFSGVFFPIDQLPGWLQPVAMATPLWHGVRLARWIALDTALPWGLGLHLGYLVVTTLVGGVLLVRLTRRKLLA